MNPSLLTAFAFFLIGLTSNLGLSMTVSSRLSSPASQSSPYLDCSGITYFYFLIALIDAASSAENDLK